LRKIEKIANKPPNLDQPVSYHISDDSMTYDQARGYCFEKNMWLADPMSPFLLDGIRDAMGEEDVPVVWFKPEWAKPGECWIEAETEAIGEPFIETAVDCWEENQAICKKGQILPELQTCLDFKLAPFEAKSQDEAQGYCESIDNPGPIWFPIANLPFFSSQDELDHFNERANLTVYREQLLGLGRAPDFPSGWGAINGALFIETDVFAWAPDQPNDGVDNNCVTTRNADPYTWENVPCDFPAGIPFSCRIHWEQFVDTECIFPALPDPPAA
jgi:hypothetical protein